jgi:hypothetical protein
MISIDFSTCWPGSVTRDALAVAGEDVHAQFFFELEDGLADARLRV